MLGRDLRTRTLRRYTSTVDAASQSWSSSKHKRRIFVGRRLPGTEHVRRVTGCSRLRSRPRKQGEERRTSTALDAPGEPAATASRRTARTLHLMTRTVPYRTVPYGTQRSRSSPPYRRLVTSSRQSHLHQRTTPSQAS